MTSNKLKDGLPMKQIKEHIQFILQNGIPKPGRTGHVDTDDASIAVFARQLRFDLNQGLPFVTSKKLQVKEMLKELTWMIRGETNVGTLGCGIWNKWSATNDLGIRHARPEADVIADLMKVKPELTTPVEASQWLFELSKKYFTQDPSKPLIDVDAIETAFEITPEFSAMVDWDKVDVEINALGVETTALKVYVKKGDCGPIYGAQWRRFESVSHFQGTKGLQQIDQLLGAYDLLVSSPDSRRNLVDSWNPGLIPKSGASINENIMNGYMGLPPCHMLFQFWVGAENDEGKRTLHLNLRLRSSDTGLGLPFNIGGYAIINHIYALEVDYGVGELVVDMGDAHIYKGHIEGLKEYIARPEHPLPAFLMTKEIYEERKRALILKWVEANTPKDEDYTHQVSRHMEKLYDPESPTSARTRFEILLNNITHEFFDGMFEGYTHEAELKLPLYD